MPPDLPNKLFIRGGRADVPVGIPSGTVQPDTEATVPAAVAVTATHGISCSGILIEIVTIVFRAGR